MTLSRRAIALASLSSSLTLLGLTGCEPAVSTVRTGSVAPSRPLDCPLELIDAPPSGGIPPGLELLGFVRVGHDEGRAPNDPEVLKMVKPEACKLGGEEVSVGMSANYTNGYRSGSTHSFMVWRHKVAAAGPQKF